MADRLPGAIGIDTTMALEFRFNGRPLTGWLGDTLASALLANGQRVIGRSFKYHRPRGVLSIGSEEPAALVTLGDGARAEPNSKATTVMLKPGLTATSQNCWPSPRFDLMAINGVFAPFFVAGFYYKTFMRPASAWEPLYERVIRRAAGLGKAPTGPDPDRYAQVEASCDVLVVGGGVAGLEAARIAAAAGADVIVAEERAWFGGQMGLVPDVIEGKQGYEWVAGVTRELAALSNVRLLSETAAYGLYDGKVVGLIETLSTTDVGLPRQRSWVVRPRQVIFATGAIEQPLAFVGNDRPGVMLAGAALGYAYRFGVKPGRAVLLVGGDEQIVRTAISLQQLGVSVVGLVDTRQAPPADCVAELANAGIAHYPGCIISRVRGWQTMAGAEVVSLQDGGSQWIRCDTLAVSGGWQPVVHLQCHLGGRPVFDESHGVFLPPVMDDGFQTAGCAAGITETSQVRLSGQLAGAAAAAVCGFKTSNANASPLPGSWGPQDRLRIFPAIRGGKRFIDWQHDVTVEDVALAHRESYRSVEHLKRYTTLGMGTDQGKTANMLGLHALAAELNTSVGEAGTTTFRPPYIPVPLGAVTATERDQDFRPIRRTAAEAAHRALGAEMITAGLWHRPRVYPQPGESAARAVRREAAQVRASVGVVDVSTLGKIALVGPDAPEVVNRLYANGMKTLQPGKARYGVMLRDDGLILDDGTVARFDMTRYLLTTTTANAALVLSHIEFLLETAWHELSAMAVSVSDHWAAYAIAGPQSRAVVQALLPDDDVSPSALPFLAVKETQFEGKDCVVMRNSYSGELAFEVYVTADYGLQLWQRILQVGQAHSIIPYGTEAMGTLRIEKGHIAGPELDGRVTAEDVGLARMVARRKPCVGQALRYRPGLQKADRPRLVGLLPVDAQAALNAGALLRPVGARDGAEALQGHVSSVTFSPAVGSVIALGMLESGDTRHGELIEAWDPLGEKSLPVKVVPPVFFDPNGERLHG